MQMTKVTNKLPIFEQRYSLSTRSVTVEDADEGLYTEQSTLPNSGLMYERILTALVEIHQHIKKNAEISVTSGTFYFKADDLEKPVLLFATQLKTDRPILVLNSTINVALVLTESSIPTLESELAQAAKAYNQLREKRSQSRDEETKIG